VVLVIFPFDHVLISLAKCLVGMWFIVEQLLVLLGVQHVPNLVWKLLIKRSLMDVTKLLESSHLQISGYQIDIWYLVVGFEN
jgi:hypothetical protein